MDGDESALTPHLLREKAEQCRRLAKHTSDARVREALYSYTQELLSRAEAAERRE